MTDADWLVSQESRHNRNGATLFFSDNDVEWFAERVAVMAQDNPDIDRIRTYCFKVLLRRIT